MQAAHDILTRPTTEFNSPIDIFPCHLGRVYLDHDKLASGAEREQEKLAGEGRPSGPPVRLRGIIFWGPSVGS